MKTVTQNFKNKIKSLGRELDNLISYELNGGTIELGNTILNSVSPHYEGNILKSVMKQLDLDSNQDIPLNTVINYKFGVKVSNNEVLDYKDNYEYIDFGSYIVYKSEKQEDTNSYKITCYDKMLYAMKEYETPKLNGTTITYPITIENYLKAIASTLGLTLVYPVTTVAGVTDNSNKCPNFGRNITSELYLDSDGKSLEYTYRDVLDDLAEVTASTIYVENDNLIVKYIDDNSNISYAYKKVGISGNTGIDVQTTDIGFGMQKITLMFTPKNITDFEIFKYDDTLKLKIVNGHFQWLYGNTIITTFENNLEIAEIEIYVEIKRNSSNVELKIIVKEGNSLVEYNYTWNYVIPYGTVKVLTLFPNGVNNFKIYANQLTFKYSSYNKITQEVGFAQGKTFTAINGYTASQINIETINEEYIKDINVNFGEIYGPINTVTFKRTGNLDAITSSIPSDLADNLKNEIAISDNQILNGNNRSDFMADILNKLYGLTYTINDFESTGIAYLDIMDNYSVAIGETTYNCLMLNDNIQVTGGLKENIYCDMPSQSETDYTTASKSDREDTRANIIVNKQLGEITLEVAQKLNSGDFTKAEIVAKINDNTSQVQINADNIDLTGKNFNLTTDNMTISSTNFSLDANGNMTANSGSFGGTVNTAQDLTVGNNAYIGQNQGSTENIDKYLYFSQDAFIKRLLMNTGSALVIQSALQLNLVCGSSYLYMFNDNYISCSNINAGNIDKGGCTLNSSTLETVYFNKTFASAPRVVLTAHTSTAGAIIGKVRDVTTTYFTAIIGGNVSGNIDFDWIAIG